MGSLFHRFIEVTNVVRDQSIRLCEIPEMLLVVLCIEGVVSLVIPLDFQCLSSFQRSPVIIRDHGNSLIAVLSQDTLRFHRPEHALDLEGSAVIIANQLTAKDRASFYGGIDHAG